MIEADGVESGKKQLKSMSWPLMDADGLPSSYIAKVLTCLSKWSVKMQALTAVVASVDPPQDALKKPPVLLLMHALVTGLFVLLLMSI